jgi:hypothetical protein
MPGINITITRVTIRRVACKVVIAYLRKVRKFVILVTDRRAMFISYQVILYNCAHGPQLAIWLFLRFRADVRK